MQQSDPIHLSFPRRRLFHRALVCGLATVLHAGISPAADAVSVAIHVDQSALAAIPVDLRPTLDIHKDESAAAKAMIESAPATKAVPVILIILGFIAIPTIYRTIREMIRETYYGGVIVDARGASVDISSSKKIPADMILFIDRNNGVTQINIDDFSEKILSDFLKKKM